MFNIDFDRITEMLLPVGLRQPAMKTWLKAISKPLKRLLNTFQSYRLEAWERLTHTGQVIYLNHILNLKFNLNPSLYGNIYISDSDDLRPDDYLFSVNDGIPYYLFSAGDGQPVNYLFSTADFTGKVDFVVNVPDNLTVNEPQVRQITDRYRPAGKRYKIEYYELNPTP